MSEIDDYAENYMDQDEYSDDESDGANLKLDKRAHHNALERKRRDHIKDSFSGLRDAIPLLHGEKINSHKASRAQILKKAAEYMDHQKEIDLLKKENKILEEKIRALELKANNSNNNGTNKPTQVSNANARTRSKSLIANSSTNGFLNSLSSNSTNSSPPNDGGGTSLLQQNRVKSESTSFGEANSDDSENLIDNTEKTVVQIVKKATNVMANGKITGTGTTLLAVNGTIIKQAQPAHSLLEPPNKRKRLIIAANTSK